MLGRRFFLAASGSAAILSAVGLPRMAFAGFLLAGLLGRSSRKLRQLGCIIVLASLGVLLSACGGTSGTPRSDPPKGTYTITFTGTDSKNAALTSGGAFTLVID